MSTQADVRSIDALKDLRVALALFSEDTLAALGAVDMEVKRTLQWLQYDRRDYWQNRIKRLREQVEMAKSELFRRKLQKTADNTPSMSEQKENLRKAEAMLQDAETRAAMVKKWEPVLQQAALEYRASTRRISSMASGEAPRAVALLERLIDSLEGYLRVTAPSTTGLASGPGPGPGLLAVAEEFLRDEPAPEPDDQPETTTDPDPKR